MISLSLGIQFEILQLKSFLTFIMKDLIKYILTLTIVFIGNKLALLINIEKMAPNWSSTTLKGLLVVIILVSVNERNYRNVVELSSKDKKS